MRTLAAVAAVLLLALPARAQERPLPTADEIVKSFFAQVRERKGMPEERLRQCSYRETEVEEELGGMMQPGHGRQE